MSGTAQPWGRDEVLAWLSATRLMLASRPGFKWAEADMDEMARYVESTSDERDALLAFLEARGLAETFREEVAARLRPPKA